MNIRLPVLSSVFLLCCAAYAQPLLTGRTNRPEINLFGSNEKVRLHFSVRNAPEESTLNVRIYDDLNKKLLETKMLPVVPDAKGNWNGSISTPSGKHGLFRAEAGLSDGTILSAEPVLPSPAIYYGITFPPEKRKCYSIDRTFWGMQGRADLSVPFSPLTGIRWILGPGRWNNYEPRFSGQFEQSVQKAKANRTRMFGTRFSQLPYTLNGKKGVFQQYPLFCIMGGNCTLPVGWKTPPHVPGIKKGWGPLTPQGEKQFTAYCKAFAAEIAASFPDLEKHYYKVIWEPDIFFPGKPRDIVRFLELAYPAIRKADPKAVICGPSISSVKANMSYFKALFDGGIWKYIDVYEMHTYASTISAPEKNELIPRIRALKGLVRTCPKKDLPFASTEMGYNDNGEHRNSKQNGLWDLRHNLILLGEGYQFSLSFYGCDNGVGEKNVGFGYFYNLDPRRKYGPRKVAPKPQAVYFSAASFLLEGAKGISCIDWLAPTVWGYAYERDGSIILALWNYGDFPVGAVVPIGTEQVRVYDAAGNASVQKTKNGNLELKLTGEPVYIEGASPLLWGKNVPEYIRMKNKKQEVCSGKSIVIKTETKIPDKNKDYFLCTSSPDDNLKIAPERFLLKRGKESVGNAFRITASPSLEEGVYPVQVQLRTKKGKLLSGIACQLAVKAPLIVDEIRPVKNSNGKWAVSFRVELLNSETETVRLSLSVDRKTISEKNAVLTPGKKANIILSLNDPAPDSRKKYDIAVTAASDRGSRVVRNLKMSFISAKRMRVPFDWNGHAKHILKKDSCIRGEDFYRGDSAALSYAWNKNALYVRMEVRDNIHLHHRTNGFWWMDDSVQLGICLEPFKKVVQGTNTLAVESELPKQTEVTMFRNQKRGIRAHYSYLMPENPKRLRSGLSASAEKLTIERRDGITVYQAAFRWKSLGFNAPPQAGAYLGITTAINDIDREYPADDHKFKGSTLSFHRGATWPKTPSLMGTLLLEP